jgi:hypothetical protein
MPDGGPICRRLKGEERMVLCMARKLKTNTDFTAQRICAVGMADRAA